MSEVSHFFRADMTKPGHRKCVDVEKEWKANLYWHPCTFEDISREITVPFLFPKKTSCAKVFPDLFLHVLLDDPELVEVSINSDRINIIIKLTYQERCGLPIVECNLFSIYSLLY